MAVTWTFWERITIAILSAILRAVSPILREALQKAIKELYEKAKQTDNPYDDMFIALLARLLGIEVE